jgi:hypothetical protein
LILTGKIKPEPASKTYAKSHSETIEWIGSNTRVGTVPDTDFKLSMEKINNNYKFLDDIDSRIESQFKIIRKLLQADPVKVKAFSTQQRQYLPNIFTLSDSAKAAFKKYGGNGVAPGDFALFDDIQTTGYTLTRGLKTVISHLRKNWVNEGRSGTPDCFSLFKREANTKKSDTKTDKVATRSSLATAGYPLNKKGFIDPVTIILDELKNRKLAVVNSR